MTSHNPSTPATTERTSQPFLYRFEAELQVNPIGVLPEGLRMANPFEGRVRAGMLEGARVWGIDHYLIRPDGIGVIDAQKTISLGALHVYERVYGYCYPPDGLALPSLHALLAPDFVWPKVPFVFRGFSSFRAAHPDFEHLNRALATIHGEACFARRTIRVETRLFAADPARERQGGAA